jgi:Porphobilinogen deaminase, dipyromethane cofactor binding domain/Glutamyl-tRNAGlu reductase, N-terminal domain
MSLLVVGLSHRSAPVEVLERVAASCADAGKVLHQLLEREHVTEALLLSTCNRVEVYAVVATFHDGLVRIVQVRTAGDASSAPVTDIGVGVFVSALREALVAGEIDAAVHSYKDLPTAADARLVLAAVPERADPRDARVARDGMMLGELPTLGCAPRSPPSGRCWPRRRPAAAPRSARSPMSSRTWVTTDGWCCGCPCGGRSYCG